MSWLSNLFGGRNPADAAQKYINQMPGTAKQYFDPYIAQGQQAYQDMYGPLADMTKDPSKFLESLLGNYEPSKSYQLKKDEALRAAGNTAAAGGMRGSMQDIEKESRLTDALLGDDMQQWLNNVLGIQKTGLAGEQGFYNTGFDASQKLEGDLMNTLGQQGNLAYQQQAEKNKRFSDLLSSILGGAGSLAGINLPSGGTAGGYAMEKLYKDLGWL